MTRLTPAPTVPNRFHRSLMIWAILALQALAPFIHAHADVLQLGHAHGPHLHQVVSVDAVGAATAHGEHGFTVAVAQAIANSRDLATGALACPIGADQKPRAPVALIRLAVAFPGSLPLHLSPPDHLLPLTLAPPRR